MKKLINDPDMLFREVAKMTKKLGKHFDTAVSIDACIWWHVYSTGRDPGFGDPRWRVFIHGTSTQHEFGSWDELRLWVSNLKKIEKMKSKIFTHIMSR